MKSEQSMEQVHNQISAKDLVKFVDEFINDERYPALPSHKFFTPKQWDALCESIPMTQEIFDRCLYVCDQVHDSVMFHRTVEQFPDLEVKYSIEVQQKHKQLHDEFKAEYLKKWGDDAAMFLD